MHGGLILVTLMVAYWLRWRWCPQPQQAWGQRWQGALMAFCLPPVMLLSAAIAILWMGHHGRMLGLPVQPYSCWLAAVGLGVATGALLVATHQGLASRDHVRQHPTVVLGEHSARCVPTDTAFAAQIGFWQPQLVVSQGLLDCLTSAEVRAVLAHEQGHVHFRDTFWFFWLGWLRWLSGWLPQTDSLWQELLLLREMRADRWAATSGIDALLLAEVLVKLVKLPLEHQPAPLEAFSHAQPRSRLEQRIAALIEPINADRPTLNAGWLLGLLPLASVLLHG